MKHTSTWWMSPPPDSMKVVVEEDAKADKNRGSRRLLGFHKA